MPRSGDRQNALEAIGDEDSRGKRHAAEGHRLVERIDRAWGNHTGVIGPAEWDKAWGTILNKGGLAALQLGGSGDVTKTNIRWTYYTVPP